ncbi:MAG: zinc-dependent alcohol dehydrogenase family protein [Pirellulaceae bacterium]
MKAWMLYGITSVATDDAPLVWTDVATPRPAAGEVLIRVRACGVCHTELDEIEGRTPPPQLPMIPGHQVVGEIVDCGSGVGGWRVGDRVGVGWIYRSCLSCAWCLSGQENLCPRFEGTGRDRNGGYAEFLTAPAPFITRVPDALADLEAAPLLCAGAIGFRSLQLTGLRNGQSLGLTGFGASAHLVLQMARLRHPASPIFVFARSPHERAFALEHGAVWAGDTYDAAPEPVQAIIDTTPAWGPVVAALDNLLPGGRLVINAIRKEETDKSQLLDLQYARHLWMEKEIKSVANVTRADIQSCLEWAAQGAIRPAVVEYPWTEANRALVELKRQHVRGAKVLRMPA